MKAAVLFILVCACGPELVRPPPSVVAGSYRRVYLSIEWVRELPLPPVETIPIRAGEDYVEVPGDLALGELVTREGLDSWDAMDPDQRAQPPWVAHRMHALTWTSESYEYVDTRFNDCGTLVERWSVEAIDDETLLLEIEQEICHLTEHGGLYRSTRYDEAELTLEQPCTPPCALADDSEEAYPDVDLPDDILLRSFACRCP